MSTERPRMRAGGFRGNPRDSLANDGLVSTAPAGIDNPEAELDVMPWWHAGCQRFPITPATNEDP